MRWRPLTTAGVTLMALVVLGAVLGAALGKDAWSAVSGAVIGLGVGVAVAVHFAVRTLAGRTADASGPEYAADSVERHAFQEALAGVAPDALSLMSLSALLSLLFRDPVAMRIVVVGALVLVVIDLGVRVGLGWRTSVADYA